MKFSQNQYNFKSYKVGSFQVCTMQFINNMRTDLSDSLPSLTLLKELIFLTSQTSFKIDIYNSSNHKFISDRNR